ncbi:MAG TPA: hypothetical protein VFB15_14350 [Candidatus Binataceae bacterium]|nr:hypothetical protein [Candidatus Binataceae bacterium]
MGELIELHERQAARERAQRRRTEHLDLEKAVALMRASLASAAAELPLAPPAAHPELLDRIERLVAMIRYGMQMIGHPPDRTASDA